MDLSYTSEQQNFRAEARDWLDAHVPKQALPSLDTAAGFQAHREWELELNAGGWAMVPWPVEYGGRGANLLEWLIFEEEYYRAGAPGRVNQNGIFLLGPTIMEYGTAEQKARYLPKMASSEEVWAQGWSEPNAGSDMAAIQATAVIDGDQYVVNGQKTWASRGAYADWLFGMFRTDPDSQRHKGLTFILVPLDAEGVTVRPIEQLDGEAGFAEVFLDDVRVPLENRLGESEGRAGVSRWQPRASNAGSCCAAPRASRTPRASSSSSIAKSRRVDPMKSIPASATPSHAAGWMQRPTPSTPTRRSHACLRAERSAPKRA